LCFFVGVGIGRAFEQSASHAHEAETDHQHAAGDHAGNLEGHPTDSETHLVSAGSSSDHAIEGLDVEAVDQKGGAGLFFSIYYCMTGVHAVHIIGGMIVLAWLLVRASKDVFHEQYFGPVDYVGLYWHLVDLIWIYLFPLLYLIR